MPVGRYYLQAAIAAQHARAATAEATDWRTIVGLYDVLARAAPGPVVEVNRASRTAARSARMPGSPCSTRCPTERSRARTCCRTCTATCSREQAAGPGPASFREAAALTRHESERALLLRRAEECEAALLGLTDSAATVSTTIVNEWPAPGVRARPAPEC